MASALKYLLSSPSHVYVVSTATRGIGLEFTRQLLTRTDATVVALHRPSSMPPQLSQLKQQFDSRMFCVPIDLEDQISVDEAGKNICHKFPRLDMLLNVAGILGDGKTTVGPERSLDKMNREWLHKTLDVNLIGHVMLTQALTPSLKKKKDDIDLSRIVNLSARVGSISDNSLGGWYSYRMTKAALNMFTKTVSIELKRHNCIAISVHPGTTDTDLSIPFQKNVAADKLFPVEKSVAMLLDVIWATDMNSTGKFFAYDGKEIPW